MHEDLVNPPHYKDLKVQPIEVIEAWNLSYSLGNVVKYISRYKNKGGVVDLHKALWYLTHEIERMEQNGR
jgi:hypothetical protein